MVGDPEFEFSMNNPGGGANDVPATYDGTRSSRDDDRPVGPTRCRRATWTATASGSGPQPNLHAGRERPHPHGLAGQIDIDRTHPEKGTLAGHKVDGSLGAPTVPPDPTAPTLVSATATTLTIEWTHPGDGGSPLTRNLEYRVEGTTDGRPGRRQRR